MSTRTGKCFRVLQYIAFEGNYLKRHFRLPVIYIEKRSLLITYFTQKLVCILRDSKGNLRRIINSFSRHFGLRIHSLYETNRKMFEKSASSLLGQRGNEILTKSFPLLSQMYRLYQYENMNF